MTAYQSQMDELKAEGGTMKETIEVDGQKYVLASSIKSNVKATSVKGKEYVIARSANAGVFAGYLESRKGDECVLLNARRIWYWKGAASLSQLSQEGTTNPAECKFPMEVPSVTLLGVCEVLSCSEKARLSIAGVKVWQQ